MQNERRAPMPDQELRLDNAAERQQTREQRTETTGQGERRGPFTFAAGWLGTAFDRSHINKQEAEERRRRNM